MSEFSDAMDTSWGASVRVFGDQCTLNRGVYDCVIHTFDLSDGVAKGRPGRTQNASGTVIMARADWNTAGGGKGNNIILPNGTFRILNHPDGATSATVQLDIGPLT